MTIARNGARPSITGVEGRKSLTITLIDEAAPMARDARGGGAANVAWRARAHAGAVWAFDVDGTLIGSVRSDVVRPGAVDVLEELVRRGVTCVLWSAGGAEYARRVAIAHGFDHTIDAYYPKHARDRAKRYTLDHFAPAHRPHVFVDDAPCDVPTDAIVVSVTQFLGGNAADMALRTFHAELASEPDSSHEDR
jgi:hypothetical protein